MLRKPNQAQSKSCVKNPVVTSRAQAARRFREHFQTFEHAEVGGDMAFDLPKPRVSCLRSSGWVSPPFLSNQGWCVVVIFGTVHGFPSVFPTKKTAWCQVWYRHVSYPLKLWGRVGLFDPKLPKSRRHGAKLETVKRNNNSGSFLKSQCSNKITTRNNTNKASD